MGDGKVGGGRGRGKAWRESHSERRFVGKQLGSGAWKGGAIGCSECDP